MAAGAVAAGGVSALAVTKVWQKKAREREEEGQHVEQ